jgi:hypothetical protein
VESKAIPVCFSLLGVFAFAVAFAVVVAVAVAVVFLGTTRALKRIHLGLLYALEESRQGLGA